MATANPGVWLGIKKCGCVRAVTVDTLAGTEQDKRDFLADGLSVVYATWEQWRADYMPRLLQDCPHDPEDAR